MKTIFIFLILLIPSVSHCQWFIHDTVALDDYRPPDLDYVSGVALFAENVYAITWVHNPPGNSTPTIVEIFLTPDDGLTWKKVFDVSDYGLSVYGSQFITADTGFSYFGYFMNTSLQKTTDGGKNWQYLNTPYKNLSFISGEKGYGMEGNVFIKYENDSLTIGDTIPDVQLPYVNFTKYKVGYCVSMVQTSGGLDYHKVLRTTDDGETWSFSLIDTLHSIKEICAPTESSCFISCDQGVLYKSTDTGYTWKQFSANGMTSISHMTFVDELNGYIASNNQLFRTIDGGETWKEQTIPDRLKILSIKMINDSIAYLSTGYNESVVYYYIVLKTTNGNNLEIIEQETAPNTLHIYPNPTTSDFTLEVPSDTKGSLFSIYDTMGKKLLNYQVCETTSLIDISQLLPGIYFGVLQTEKHILNCKIIKE